MGKSMVKCNIFTVVTQRRENFPKGTPVVMTFVKARLSPALRDNCSYFQLCPEDGFPKLYLTNTSWKKLVLVFIGTEIQGI